MKSITFTFGRFQPPHWDHTQLILAGCDIANAVKNCNFKVYTGGTQNKKRNPLTFEQKISTMKKLWPYVSISENPQLKTIFDIINSLREEEYEDFHLVVGEDRYVEFVNKILPQVYRLPLWNSNAYFEIHPTKHIINIHSTTLRDLIQNKQFETFVNLYKQNTTLEEEDIISLLYHLSDGMKIPGCQVYEAYH